jgi:hypothetical protein
MNIAIYRLTGFNKLIGRQREQMPVTINFLQMPSKGTQ